MGKEKIALVFGASGLVGSELVKQLAISSSYSVIKVFNRSAVGYELPKIEEFVVDYSRINDYTSSITGDVVFCCLGTTIAKAGSQRAFRAVDYDLPCAIGRIAKDNGIERFLLVSSIGARSSSSNFYLKTKGQCEDTLGEMGFQHFNAIQPSLLLGERHENRIGENIGKIFMQLAHPIIVGPFKKYRAIEAETVAKAMVLIANYETTNGVYESDQLQKTGASC